MELSRLLNKEEPPSRCDHQIVRGNTPNKESVEQWRRPLRLLTPPPSLRSSLPPPPSFPPWTRLPQQPSLLLQTAANCFRASIQPRPHRIEPQAGGIPAPGLIDMIPCQQVVIAPPKRPISESEGSEGVAAGAPAAKKRGPFCEEQRKETETTRRNRACFRCRNQQIRCVADSDDPKEWCRPCKGYNTDNKKTIHKLPCLRVKMTASVFFRTSLRGGPIPRSQRWELPPDPSSTKGGKLTIKITFGLCEEPIALRVFEPKPSESKRPAKNPVGNVSSKFPTFPPAYHIADMEWLRPYFDRNALSQQTLDLTLRDSHPLIQKTFREALLHYQRLSASTPVNKREHLSLMRDLFKLWFAMRHLIGSSWICGKTIGADSKASERTFTPASITAQFEVNLFEAITPLRTKVLQGLENMLGRNRSEDWYTVYLAVFILLHEISVATKDQNNEFTADSSLARYSSPDFVLNLHEGANTLILHWQYWRRNADPLKIANHHYSPLSDLTDDEFEFVKSSYETMRDIPARMERLPVQDAWEHELFWISQMFGPWEKFVGLAAPMMERRKPEETSLATGSPSSPTAKTTP